MCLKEIASRAICLLPGPLSFTELHVFNNNEPLENRNPSDLAVAVAQGKLPRLREIWGWLGMELNASLLEHAIEHGHLRGLSSILRLEAGPIFEVLARCFQERCSLVQDQGQDTTRTDGTPHYLIEELYVDNSEQSDPKWKGLKALLRLPICNQSQKMELYTEELEWDFDIIRAGLDLVSSYIARPGAGLCLRGLKLNLDGDCCLNLGPLARALRNGGAPNLKNLTLVNLAATGVRQLGEIYRGGGCPSWRS